MTAHPIASGRPAASRRPGPAILALALLLALIAGAAPVAAAPAEPLLIESQASPDGTRLGLSWSAQDGAMPQVFRRRLGETGIESWAPYKPQIALPQRILDSGLEPGQAYEYQIRIETGRKTLIGFWAYGTKVPVQPQSGRAIVVVDETVEAGLADRLDRLVLDLIGDGWRTTRLSAPRGDDRDSAANMTRAIALRQRIGDALASDPFAPQAVLLVGHLPVMRSGWIAPDGHDKAPQATDLFYVTPNGFWPPVTTPDGKLALEPSVIPGGRIAAPIGRVDFADMAAEFGPETELLADWLDRNHRWRQGDGGAPRRAYAKSQYLMLERAGLLNIVGPPSLIEAGHHDHQGRGPFLFGVDFGSYRGNDYFSRPPVEAVFTINFGSGKQQFDRANNPMRALLAGSDTALSVAWGGRPSWLLHGMALNETIGQAQMRTVNNGNYRSGGLASREYGVTGQYDWINPVWVNLIGDPTLRPFPQRPATGFTARRAGDDVRLGWSLPDDAESAVLYRAERREGPYDVIAEDLGGTDFTDRNAPPAGWYMLRAKGLTRVNAGSVYRLSAGVFAAAP
ncbi:MAG: hypothetical protein CMI51_05875 [Paracoccus sp.]|uniref:hypothetical protein n=2 Tax=Paracoccus sp. TaxID=267 RepID=UPI000C48E377|nr:hypothetical protein [Paracoccus sp. (in: a-proteobacteria)]MBA48535.1 hypothetical protein [Paracoccus sp. (in: a-proteobacteria)]